MGQCQCGQDMEAPETTSESEEQVQQPAPLPITPHTSSRHRKFSRSSNMSRDQKIANLAELKMQREKLARAATTIQSHSAASSPQNLGSPSAAFMLPPLASSSQFDLSVYLDIIEGGPQPLTSSFASPSSGSPQPSSSSRDFSPQSIRDLSSPNVPRSSMSPEQFARLTSIVLRGDNELNLSYCPALSRFPSAKRREVYAQVAQAIVAPHNASRSIVNLSGNALDDDFAAEFSRVLRANTTILSLNLDDNNIGSTGIMHLAEALRTNTTLQELKLADQTSAASLEAANALVAAITSNPSTGLINLKMGPLFELTFPAQTAAIQEHFRRQLIELL